MSLSDLFAEREQYDWMLDTLFEVYKAHPGEDEIAMQYLNVGVCKAAAVVGVVSRNSAICCIVGHGFQNFTPILDFCVICMLDIKISFITFEYKFCFDIFHLTYLQYLTVQKHTFCITNIEV